MEEQDLPAIAVMISGRGSNLRSIIDASHQNRFNGKISLVISNVENAGGVEIATQAGIPSICIPHNDFSDRSSFEHAVTEALLNHQTHWLVLAGFMRILTEEFTIQWRGRLINIHPSLLPRYPGLNTHARALKAGETQAGASVHFVTPQLDGGPVILQGVVDVEEDDTPGKLAERVLSVEHDIYPMALEWLTQGRVRLESMAGKDTVMLDDQIVESPPQWYRETLQIETEKQ